MFFKKRAQLGCGLFACGKKHESGSFFVKAVHHPEFPLQLFTEIFDKTVLLVGHFVGSEPKRFIKDQKIIKFLEPKLHDVIVSTVSFEGHCLIKYDRQLEDFL
jgi:hypothetical protein